MIFTSISQTLCTPEAVPALVGPPDHGRESVGAETVNPDRITHQSGIPASASGGRRLLPSAHDRCRRRVGGGESAQQVTIFQRH